VEPPASLNATACKSRRMTLDTETLTLKRRAFDSSMLLKWQELVNMSLLFAISYGYDRTYSLPSNASQIRARTSHCTE
jgi:hypothetical protein